MDPKYDYEVDGPIVEKKLLLKFVIKRLDELIGKNSKTMRFILQALALSSVANNPAATEELRELFFPTSLVKNCRNILSNVLNEADTESSLQLCQSPIHRLSEKSSRQVLYTAILEVKELIVNQNFEFTPIIKVLGWIALQPYPKRLQEFEAVWRSNMQPAETAQAVKEVLWEAFKHRDDDPYKLEEQSLIEKCSGND